SLRPHLRASLLLDHWWTRAVMRAARIALLLVLCASCGSGPKKLPGICFAQRREPGRPVTPSEWLNLIVKAKEQNGGICAQEDCTGWPIKFTPAPDNCVVKTPPLGTPQPVPLTEESIVERMLPNDQRLIWVITHRFDNGDGFGPVALVQVYPR